MISVLLVEDEPTLSQILKETLEGEGFDIRTAANGEEGLSLFHSLHPDVLVADVMMPRMDGFEMVRRIRQTDRRTPILFLTARSATDDVVEGFELGANDYLKKPFGMKELIVRIKALLGRAADYANTMEMETGKETNASPEAIRFEVGEYRFDSVAQQLDFHGSTEALSYRESEILKRLCLNSLQVVNTQDILLELWGDDSFFNTRSLHVFITKLRHKLAKDPHIRIVNVRGIGYKLIV
ncbi:MAG: response regulator transcription factor [Prevotellaceae bacterium]|jgi:DNA-binding response OmpR family regulator|nr:response regulator transcription factor [Prevotellaceae bacterium]